MSRPQRSKRLQYELPPTMNWSAPVLANTFSKDELCYGIAYLEGVIKREIHPLASDLEKLGINYHTANTEEYRAVQLKLANAVRLQPNEAA